ncbi:predicted protein [Naegleria gruberi]|uniref:Predicted protein n=1 Tax=Naegleria gruberi TaxID=5762 RepID=D2VG26_NAEGR|nr:uncharacterized protein NAEGRDRAFT_58109 [Naegleria gruberi]EFC44280.1 predicted protein [Naegleria gruberi]|eukprot:XP_002677024.1 predicted protein [Naegleria gruberi strain NEG-M]
MKKVYSDGFIHGSNNFRQAPESSEDDNLFHSHMNHVLNQSLSLVIKFQRIPQDGSIISKMVSQELTSLFPILMSLSKLIESNSSLEEQGTLCKLAECLLSIEISKRDGTTVKPTTNLLERMDAVKVSFENFERTSALMVLLAFNYIDKPSLDQVEQCIEHCDLMLYNSDKLEPSDLTCMAMILFNIYKKQPCLELLGDAFILSSFASVVDPLGAETLMLQIGNSFIVKFKQTFSPLLSQLVEFLSRRISTSNLGSLLFSSDTFCEILYSNITRNLRPDIIPSSSFKFGEDLKCVSRKEFKSQNFLEDLLRIGNSNDSNQQMLSLYKTINSTFLSIDSFQTKAHKLALVCQLVVKNKLEMDRNELLNALLVCIHNFHLVFETQSFSHISHSSESMPVSGSNTLCFDLYYFSVFQFYNLLTDLTTLKYPAAENCFYFKNINNRFLQFLWKKVIENLQLLQNKISARQQPKDFKDHYLTSILSSSFEDTHKHQLEEIKSNIEQITILAEDNQRTIDLQIEKAKDRLNHLNQSNLTSQEIRIIKSFGTEMQSLTGIEYE